MAQKSKNNLSEKIFIKTFGCQMNEYDSDRIRDLTKNYGFLLPSVNQSNCDQFYHIATNTGW